MSRHGIGYIFAALAALALAMPLAAHNNAGKDSKTVKASMAISDDATLGGKLVKAGTYDVKADETKVTLSRNGKVVAEAPVEWMDEQSKSNYSSIKVDSGSVKEIHFNGKARYAALSSASMPTNGGQQ
ncbi:MAG TPA: hypothetical protein VJW93_04930 [Candidatus Acidoferrales bacterium]|nr:hypothetical protein [Candidatus Acidoferrales bacterium]